MFFISPRYTFFRISPKHKKNILFLKENNSLEREGYMNVNTQRIVSILEWPYFFDIIVQSSKNALKEQARRLSPISTHILSAEKSNEQLLTFTSLILKNLSSMLDVEVHRVTLRITGQRLVQLLSLADLLTDDNFLIRSLIFDRLC